jgi:ribosomal protein S18 acetylase RimI-like enzyme
MTERIMKALIRRATPDDAGAIARVEVDSWRAAYLGLVPAAVLNDLSVAVHAARWRRVLSGGPASWASVLIADGAMLGFVSAGPTRDADDDARAVGEVYTIYLLPSAWGRGLGAALLDSAQAYLARRRYRAVTLWVLEGNTRARRFYELSGFNQDRGSAWAVPSTRGVARRPVRVGPTSLPEIRYRRVL